MKRKILFISILSALSLNLNSQASTQNELVDILNQLESGQKEKVVIKSTTPNRNIPVIQNKENIEGLDADVSKVITSYEDQFESQVVLDKSNNEDLKTEINSHVFLLNIPIETQILANVDLKIFPFRDAMIFDDGNIVGSSPLKFTDETTFCYIAVKKSGHVRRIQASNDKGLVITANSSTKKERKSQLDPSKILTVYETVFAVDNQHIEAIKCFSTEKSLPMKIEDFKYETGNIMKFVFPPVVDIL